MNSLSTAQLAIYSVLIIPVFFIFFRHLRTGLLGWLYLIAFCSLRISGASLALNESTKTSASIISSVGLSPLLLATSGILHEARIYRGYDILNRRAERIMLLLFHVLVASGIGVLASGASALESNTTGTTTLTAAQLSSDQHLVVVGIAILTACWALIVLAAILSSLPNQQDRRGAPYHTGTLLYYSVLAALPFLGIRVVYSLVALTTKKQDLNPVTGSLAIRVVLAFIPEVIITLIYIAFGIVTRSYKDPERRPRGDRKESR